MLFFDGSGIKQQGGGLSDKSLVLPAGKLVPFGILRQRSPSAVPPPLTEATVPALASHGTSSCRAKVLRRVEGWPDAGVPGSCVFAADHALRYSLMMNNNEAKSVVSFHNAWCILLQIFSGLYMTSRVPHARWDVRASHSNAIVAPEAASQQPINFLR